MKQKFLYSCFIIIMMCGIFTKVNATTVEVKSLSEFSTSKPPSTITVEILKPLEIVGLPLPAGTEITGELVDVKCPKRLKRNAKFSFRTVSYKGTDGISHTFEEQVIAKYTHPIDKEHIAESAATGVGNFFVKGFGMGVAAVEGAVKNEEDNRIKSSVVSVYEASPVSYIEKGKDLIIKVSDSFYLKFPDDNSN